MTARAAIARALYFELRDDPDDLPITADSYAEAERKGWARADRLGGPVLLYAITADGEHYLGAYQ